MTIDSERLARQLEFLRLIDREKQVVRRTYLLDSSRRENDAEHSWHMAVCCMLLWEYCDEKEQLDLNQVIRICLVHDLVEIFAGDTYAYDTTGAESQSERESLAADRLYAVLPDDQRGEFRGLWEQYEAQDTPEARFARVGDSFMPLYHNYLTQGRSWLEHGVRREQVERRMLRIKASSEALWSFCVGIVDDAVEKGWLLP